MKIELITACASDLDVVNAARVSFAQSSAWETFDDPDEGRFELRLSDRDRGLIGFLMRNRHGTPFEHGYFRFHVEAPIFVFREWHRHRIAHSYNEMSGRYVELEKRFYEPERFRVQHGKPGAYEYVELEDWIEATNAQLLMNVAYERAWKSYQTLLELGIAKEQARAVLPVGIYSQMYWSCNPRSLMHFLSLRNARHALKEIRDLAAQAEKVLVEHMPVTHAAFVENERVAP